MAEVIVIVIAYIWAASAGYAWESLAATKGRQGRWLEVTIGALMPIHNTYVAWGYVRERLNEIKG